MKRSHEPGQAVRREQRTPARHKDAYRSDAKPADCTCPRCGVSSLSGRWTWRMGAPNLPRETCPACRRIEANDPAGFVTLSGPFFATHREEVMARVNAIATMARSEHPMQRIVGAQEQAGGVLVTTTDAHLARALVVGLQNSFQGDVDLVFGRDENQVRASWTR